MDFDREKIIAALLAESEEALKRTEQHLMADETDPSHQELPKATDHYATNRQTAIRSSAIEAERASSPAAVPGSLPRGTRNRTLRAAIERLDQRLDVTGRDCGSELDFSELADLVYMQPPELNCSLFLSAAGGLNGVKPPFNL